MTADERVLVVTGTRKPDGRQDAETQFEWFLIDYKRGKNKGLICHVR